jgi:hypothetical protein
LDLHCFAEKTEINQGKLRQCIMTFYYMASITSGEMAIVIGREVHYVKTNACILKQNSKTN